MRKTLALLALLAGFTACAFHIDARKGTLSAALGDSQVAPCVEPGAGGECDGAQVTGGQGSDPLFGFLMRIADSVASLVGAGPPPVVNVTVETPRGEE